MMEYLFLASATLFMSGLVGMFWLILHKFEELTEAIHEYNRIEQILLEEMRKPDRSDRSDKENIRRRTESWI